MKGTHRGEPGMALLKVGPGRIVALEPDGAVVRKTYTGPDPATAAAMATRIIAARN